MRVKQDFSPPLLFYLSLFYLSLGEFDVVQLSPYNEIKGEFGPREWTPGVYVRICTYPFHLV